MITPETPVHDDADIDAALNAPNAPKPAAGDGGNLELWEAEPDAAPIDSAASVPSKIQFRGFTLIPEGPNPEADLEAAQPPHDFVDFMREVSTELSLEYARIRKRTLSDPGTAGDEGEENWAEILRGWLPSTYHVVTKGSILTALGEASPQVDVLILEPDYPRRLLTKKHYLSAGVVAAFECKNTLRRSGIKQAVENSKTIAGMLVRERRSAKGYWRPEALTDPVHPELHKPLLYGLLAHSHDWATESARQTITALIDELDEEISSHPREMLDLVCVADVAVWSAGRAPSTWVLGDGRVEIVPNCRTTFSCLYQDRWVASSVFFKGFTTIGALLSRLYSKLRERDPRAAKTADYLKFAVKDGASGGGRYRDWGELLSPAARAFVTNMGRTGWDSYW